MALLALLRAAPHVCWVYRPSHISVYFGTWRVGKKKLTLYSSCEGEIALCRFGVQELSVERCSDATLSSDATTRQTISPRRREARQSFLDQVYRPSGKSEKNSVGKKLWGPINILSGRVGNGPFDVSRPNVKVWGAKKQHFCIKLES